MTQEEKDVLELIKEKKVLSKIPNISDVEAGNLQIIINKLTDRLNFKQVEPSWIDIKRHLYLKKYGKFI